MARLFACDCAIRALPAYEAQYPGAWRPRLAIAAAGKFALELISEEEMRRAGVRVKQAPKTRASLAARATTKRDAKAATDREAERECQSQRLMEYLKQERRKPLEAELLASMILGN
jgi:hypothetical protein